MSVVQVVPYMTCDNKDEQLLTILKKMLYQDCEGNYYIGVVTFDGEIIDECVEE
jgi:hypothetical protein